MPQAPSFADQLRRYRLEARLTQEELAERAGLSARAISDLERGARRAPYRETVRLLADALGIDIGGRAALEAAARRPRAADPAQVEMEEAVPGAATASSSIWRGSGGDGATAGQAAPLARGSSRPGLPTAASAGEFKDPESTIRVRPQSDRAPYPSDRPLRIGPAIGLGVAIALLVGLLFTGLVVSAHSGGIRSFRASAGGSRQRTASAGTAASAGAQKSGTPYIAVYAGTGEAGHLNGARTLAQFSFPFVLNLGLEGSDMVISDPGNQMLRDITGAGIVRDFCGAGIKGYADGPCTTAQFSDPTQMTRGPDGTVYVTDNGNLRIRTISPAGIVSTLAGSGVRGFADGEGATAQFSAFGGIDVDRGTGVLYVVDNGNNRVRRITPGGVVTTYAGNGLPGYADGPATIAQFSGPRGVNVDARGNVYIHDGGNHRIRKIAPDGVVSTLAGSGEVGFADGPGAQAQFGGGTFATTTDMTTGNLYMMDAGNKRIRKITPEGVVSTVFEFTDPDQTPFNIRVSPTGDIYLTDPQHNRIYKISGVISR